MQKCKRRVAILMATYNGERYLKEQLDSILKQEYKDFECFIHDDGSTDRTLEIIDEYETKYPNVFKVCRYAATGGAKENFFSLLREVDAKIYAFSDQDDVWFPEKLAKMMAGISNTNETGDLFFCYSDLVVTDENLNTIDASFLHTNEAYYDHVEFKDALLRGMCPGCVMLFSKHLRDIALEINNLENIYMHDWWLYALALGCGSNVKYIKEPTMYYRQHGQNTLGYHKRSFKHIFKGLYLNHIHGFIKEKQLWALRPYLLASELAKNQHVLKKNIDFCGQVIDVHKKNKILRMLFYYSNYRGTPNLGLRLLFV